MYKNRPPAYRQNLIILPPIIIFNWRLQKFKNLRNQNRVNELWHIKIDKISSFVTSIQSSFYFTLRTSIENLPTFINFLPWNVYKRNVFMISHIRQHCCALRWIRKTSFQHYNSKTNLYPREKIHMLPLHKCCKYFSIVARTEFVWQLLVWFWWRRKLFTKFLGMKNLWCREKDLTQHRSSSSGFEAEFPSADWISFRRKKKQNFHVATRLDASVTSRWQQKDSKTLLLKITRMHRWKIKAFLYVKHPSNFDFG